jgi:hypothetical protein
MKTSFSSTRSGLRQTFGDFVCLVCHHFVSAEAALSGVQNRNHCPYCLSSRHLDLYSAGDRLSACKASMRPIALTLKKTLKKYPGRAQGELMLVHLCTDCGGLSINRIAADDDRAAVLEIFERSRRLEAPTRALLTQNGVSLLEAGQQGLVREQLFGRN